MFTVSSHFIGSFKLGDNINHNLRIITLLYRYFEAGEETERELLCKPIILILVSITEAILHDFHFRIRHKDGALFNRETRHINGHFLEINCR